VPARGDTFIWYLICLWRRRIDTRIERLQPPPPTAHHQETIDRFGEAYQISTPNARKPCGHKEPHLLHPDKKHNTPRVDRRARILIVICASPDTNHFYLPERALLPTPAERKRRSPFYLGCSYQNKNQGILWAQPIDSG
jgi:hypothetical protein